MKKTVDCLLVDPPRSGMDDEMLDTIMHVLPKKIVYISCNPSTFARDVKLFSEKGYVLKKTTSCGYVPTN